MAKPTNKDKFQVPELETSDIPTKTYGESIGEGQAITPVAGNTYVVNGPIQSPNYKEGVSGWRINTNGDIEGASVTMTGGNIEGGDVNATATINGSTSENVQKRAEYPWTKGTIMLFENDGFTESGVALSRNPLITQIKVTAGDAATYVQSGSFGDWDVDCEFSITTNNYSDSGDKGDLFLGLHSAAATIPTTARHIGFFIDAGVAYTSSSDGTTQETTDISSSITLTSLNNLRFVFDAGTSIKFYVNDTLVATHTTKIPSSDNDVPAIHLRGTGSGSGEAQIDIKHTATCVTTDF